jgi:hypothetical protein
MAIFKWHILSLKKGSATPHSDYIWGRNSFHAKDDVVSTGCGNLPAFCQGDPAPLWIAADLHERHKGSAGRELVVSLPRELGRAEWQDLVGKLIQHDIGPKPYQYAIHVPREDVHENSHPHAHILYCDRVPDGIERPPERFFRRPNPKTPELGGCRKDSGGRSPKQLRLAVIKRKSLWAELQNQALASGGHAARVDHRSSTS